MGLNLPTELRMPPVPPADGVALAVQRAMLLPGPKKIRALKEAYWCAIHKYKGALAALGHFQPDVTMADDWDNGAFYAAVEQALDAGKESLVVDVTELGLGDEGCILLRPIGRAKLTIGYRAGHEGRDRVTRTVDWEADGVVWAVNGRTLAIYTVLVDEEDRDEA